MIFSGPEINAFITPPRCIFSIAGSLLLHSINLSDRLSLFRVVCLDVDFEVCHSDAEHLQQCGLMAVHDLTLFAHSVGRIECDLTLIQPGGHAPFPDGSLNAVRQREVILDRQFSTSGVHNTSGDCEGLSGGDTSARKVGLRVRSKVLEDIGGFAVCEEETDVAREVLGELGEVGEMLLSGRHAQGFGHDLGLAKEESARMLL